MESQKFFKNPKKVKKIDFWPFFSIKVGALFVKFPIMTFVFVIMKPYTLKTFYKINRMLGPPGTVESPGPLVYSPKRVLLGGSPKTAFLAKNGYFGPCGAPQEPLSIPK